ncbi:MAG: hypothetical protein N2319_11395 [Candidatus Kapabacteria bacterium]|nr:hypothetical protein [Candidatus Kapabacteria bacterium]
MRNKAVYFGSLLVIVLLYIYASNYKLTPPIYKIQKYDFKNEQESLLKPNFEDIDKFENILYSRNLNRDSLSYLILDSIVNARITDRDRYLADLDLKNYVLESKKDSLIIVSKPKEIEFVKDIINAKYFENLPEKYNPFIKKNDYNDVILFMKNEDIALDLASLNWNKSKNYYFITNENYNNGLLVRKLDELYSTDELLDKNVSISFSDAIPEEILYPYSTKKYWLIPIFIIAALFPVFLSIKNKLFSKQKKEYYNPQRTVAIVWMILAFLFLLVVLSVIVLEIDINEGGGAMIFLGLFLFVVSIIVFLIYLTRAIQFDRIYKALDPANDDSEDELILAKWTYDKAFWDEFINVDMREKLSTNKSLFIITTILIVIIFGYFMIEDTETAPYIGLAGLAFIIFLFLISRLTPVLSARRLKNSNPECIITRTGLILGKQFHNWSSMGTRLESVRFTQDEQAMLEIIYSYPGKVTRSNYTILVPVPPDQLKKAKEIVEILENEIKFLNNSKSSFKYFSK